MTPDQTKRAKAVIASLVEAEPRPDTYTISEDAWLTSVTKRIRAERWQDVCAAIEADPDLSAATIAQRLTTAPVCAPAGREPVPVPEYTAEPWQPPSAQERMTARTRLSQIREALKETS